MGLTVRGVVLNDSRGRNPGPGLIEPSIPDVVWISAATKVHLELRLHDIGRATAEQRFGVSRPIRMRVVIGALETFEPFFVRPFVRETCCTKHKSDCCRQELLPSRGQCFMHIRLQPKMERGGNDKGRLLVTSVIWSTLGGAVIVRCSGRGLVKGAPEMSVAPPGGQDRIMIYGPKSDGTYIIEFRMADGESLAISVPAGEI